MKENVLMYIRSQNFSIKSELAIREIPLFENLGKLKDKNTLSLFKNHEEKEPIAQLKSKYFLIATGNRACTELPGYKGLHKAVTNEDIFQLKKRPKSAIVLGGGVTASEFASFLTNLGVRTHLVHRSKILSHTESDFVDSMLKELQKNGLKLSTNIKGADI